MHLPVYDHRVDLPAAVVNSQVPRELDLARVRVQLHHRHVRPEREREVGRVVERRRLKARLHPFRHVPGHVRHQRYLVYRLRLVRRALHEETAVLVLDILDGRLQQVRGDRLALLPQLAGAQRNGRAANGGRPAAVGAPAHRRRVSVSVDDLYVVHVHPQLVGDDLGEGSLLALAVGGRAYHHVHLARGVEPDDRALP